MSSSFEMPEVDWFTTGTIGPPGARVFYLQAAGAGRVVSLRLEKAQVAALTEFLATLLADLPVPDPSEVPAELELREPVVAEWVVGQIGVVFDEAGDRLLLQAEESVPEDEADADAGAARFSLTRAQVTAFVVRAALVVAAGRPPCPLCGRALDPEGHVCVKTNGHRPH